MKELAGINSPKELQDSMRKDWKFQVAERKKHGSYPTSVLPSKVYTALYGSPPFSHNRKMYLIELDKEWRANHGEKYQFVFHFKGSTIPYLIENVEDYNEAFSHAVNKLIGEGIGIGSIPLAKHLMNRGELEFDSRKIE